jgi:ABC-2 type transport system permease protein
VHSAFGPQVANSGFGLLWDRQFGFLKETLVAPVPRVHIAIGRTAGGATVALLQGVLVLAICLIAGGRPRRPPCRWRSCAWR